MLEIGDMVKISNTGTSEGAVKGWEVKHGQRLKASHLVEFKPVTGPNGNSLVAYEWKWKPISDTNKEGDEVMKKVSDWDSSDPSAETGRDLVHHFHVKAPSGETRIVSSESLPTALGYKTDVPSGFDSVKGLVSASKTLAKNKMKLAALEAQQAEYDAHKAAVDAMPMPTEVTSEEIVSPTSGLKRTKFKKGDAEIYSLELGPITKERAETLDRVWKRNRMEERGAKAPYGLYEAKTSVERQEQKVKKLAAAIQPDTIANSMVKISNPDWVADHDIWLKAKEHIGKSLKESDPKFWPEVAKHYEQLGGKVKGKVSNSVKPDGVVPKVENSIPHLTPGSGLREARLAARGLELFAKRLGRPANPQETETIRNNARVAVWNMEMIRSGAAFNDDFTGNEPVANSGTSEGAKKGAQTKKYGAMGEFDKPHWAITHPESGKVLASGNHVGMTAEHLAEMAKGYQGGNARIAFGDEPFAKQREYGPLFGHTWEQIKGMQQKHRVDNGPVYADSTGGQGADRMPLANTRMVEGSCFDPGAHPHPNEVVDRDTIDSIITSFKSRKNFAQRFGRICNGTMRLDPKPKLAPAAAPEEPISNCECTGIFCKLPEDKIENRFTMPADNWYHVAPTGEHPHPKGLVQVIDPEAVNSMVANFRKQAQTDPNFPGLLVDYDHVSQGGSTESAGWITNLSSRPDGLWANIAWSDSGRKKVEGGEYRLVSPVWKRKDCVPVDGDKNRCRPVVLDSLGLTNEPNMKGLQPLTMVN